MGKQFLPVRMFMPWRTPKFSIYPQKHPVPWNCPLTYLSPRLWRTTTCENLLLGGCLRPFIDIQELNCNQAGAQAVYWRTTTFNKLAMKTKLLLTIALLLGVSSYHWAQSSSSTSKPEHAYVEVVVTQDMIWLMPDEKPVDNLPVRVLNAQNVVVLEKTFCSRTKDWSLDVSALAPGKYRILIGSIQTEYLDKQGRKGVL